MKPRRHHHRARRERGSMLLEALFGILIFSMGILALVGLQASSVKQVSSGKFRTDASLLANQLMGQMWVSDRTPSTLNTQFATGGASYTTWLADVTAALPQAATYPPTVTVTTITGSSPANTHAEVTINMRWKAPNEPAAEPVHSYVLIGEIK
jgi:type IV pilus assembly protein PilV